ncbi:MAG TPA: glycosyltransferase family 39 protein, partial [Anaerolineales bacterium]
MSKHGRWIFYLALAAIALLGMLALLRSTPYGMGLVNDSATYIEGASNIIKGGGYVRISGGGEIKPITHFPPLFSLLLAGLGLVGVDLLQAARWMITILFGIAIYLVGLSVFKISRSPWFALFGAFLLAISDVHLGVYSFALSEPLFIALMLSAFLCLAEAFDRDHWVWPMLAGILLSLAYLTRYAGVSLFITSLLVLLVIPHREKLKRVGILLAGALPPVLIWHAYSLLASGAGSVGNRQFAWHPPSGSTLFEGMKNLLTWIAPHDLLASGAIWGRALSLLSIVLLPALLAWLIWMLVERISAVREDEAC